jgi:hypothetical protein
MDLEDEARQLRRRVEVLEAILASRIETSPSGAVSVLARTVAVSSYPTVAQAVYGLQALRNTSALREGGSVGLTPVGNPFFALNLGSTVPPVGTDVIATDTGGRSEFRYDA